MPPDLFLAKKLMEIAGPVVTREILLLGDPVSAQWMYNRGLIARVAPKHSLEDEVQKITESLSENAQLARQSADSKEGMLAKLEKRKPKFTGI